MPAEIAVIAAHPDDEILGCGATMAKHAAQGDRVHVLILAEGVTSRDGSANECDRSSELAHLRSQAEQAGQIVGIASLQFGGYQDNRMDQYELLDVVKKIESFLNRINPRIVYTHHAGDMNIDHWIVHRAVTTAMRPMSSSTFSRLLHFEVASSTEWGSVATGVPFVPQWFEDVSPFIDLKLQALNAYVSELRGFPHPRSKEGILAQARFRGVCVGCHAAEAFMLGWQINRVES